MFQSGRLGFRDSNIAARQQKLAIRVLVCRRPLHRYKLKYDLTSVPLEEPRNNNNNNKHDSSLRHDKFVNGLRSLRTRWKSIFVIIIFFFWKALGRARAFDGDRPHQMIKLYADFWTRARPKEGERIRCPGRYRVARFRPRRPCSISVCIFARFSDFFFHAVLSGYTITNQLCFYYLLC